MGLDPGALLDGLDPAQREAVTTPAAPLCVIAGAGSGKTRVLTRRIAYRIATGQADAARTMAVTFTRKAADELRTRLHRLGLADQVSVGTLHSLAYTQMRRYWDKHGQARPRVIDNSRRGLSADERRNRGVVEFDDLLLHFTEAMSTDPRFAEGVRWYHRHIYVDEFQDVTPTQSAAVMAWVGDRTDLCVVGDPDQAIYGWNGADPALLADLSRRCTTVRLDANYRSSPAIVEAAAKVLGRPPPVAASDRGDTPPTLTAYATAHAEAEGLARSVRLAHAPNTAWSDIAVLVRRNADVDPIAAALQAAGIPFRIMGRLGLLARPAVRDGLNGLVPNAPAIEEARRLRALAHDHADRVEQGALHEVADMARDFDALVPGGSVAAFREWLLTTRPGDATITGDAVCLATFHKAKGLEWPTVFVAGLSGSADPGDAEERRLLYVAMTRAERRLHLSHVGSRPALLPADVVDAAPPPHLDTRALIEQMRRLLAQAS
ncbi:MAG TPA: ATP-dependent helicase [Acidimicrobiales bacterium]|nr:ATP-dependent helicase [Acidimicrobiales bacterium]